MKQQLRNHLRIGIFFSLICLFLFSCVQDKIDNENVKESGSYTISITDYEHLNNTNRNVTKKSDKFLKSNSTFQRTATSNELGFTIDEDKVQIMELANFTTYTFIAERENPEPNYLDNYVLKQNNDGSYNQYLLKYKYSLDSQENIVFDTDYLEIQVIDDETLLFNRTNCVPEFVDVHYELVCSLQRCSGSRANGKHEVGDDQCECLSDPGPDCIPAGMTCSYEHVFIMTECPGGSDLDPYDDPNSNDDTTTTTGGNSNTDTETNDNDTENDDGEDDLPAIPLSKNEMKNCNSLKKLSQTDEFSANINPLVQELREKLNEDNEFSVNFKKNINYEEEFSFPNNDGIIEGDSKTSSTIYWGSQQFGNIHTHPVGTIYMFSWIDVARLRLVYDSLHQDFTKNDVFLMIVNGDGTVYALKIDDIDSLGDKLDLETANLNIDTSGLNDEQIIAEKEKILNDKLAEKYRMSDNDESIFLKKFISYGISLYKAEDENLSNWSKLEYDNSTLDNPSIISKPCN